MLQHFADSLTVANSDSENQPPGRAIRPPAMRQIR